MTSLVRKTAVAAALTLAAAVVTVPSMAAAHNFGRGGFNQNTSRGVDGAPSQGLGLFDNELSRAFGLEEGCVPYESYGEDCG